MIIHRVVQPLPQLILKDFYLPPKETLCLLGCSVLSYVQLFVTPWTVACQVPLSMGFPRQEYRSRLPFPPPVDLPNLGIEPASKSPALTVGFFTTSTTWEASKLHIIPGISSGVSQFICLVKVFFQVETR